MGESTKQRLPIYRISFVLVVLGLSGAAGWRLASATREAREPDEGLYVSPQHLDIGEVWENPAFKWEVPIENHTTKDIHIDGFLPSCTCLSIEPPSLVVPARESATVTLTLNLMLTSRKNADLQSKEVDVGFAPHLSEGLPSHAGWMLTGRVRRVLKLEPRTIYFETGLVRGQPFTAQSVQVTSFAPLEKLAAQCDPLHGTVVVERRAGTADAFHVAVTPRANLPAGPFRFEVMLEPKSGGNATLPTVTIPVEGKIVEDIQAVPDFLLFGAQQTGTSGKQTVILRSASQKRFTVEVIKPIPEGVAVEPSEDAGENGKAFYISQRFSKQGKQEDNILFSIRTTDGNSSTVTIKVLNIGLPSK
jgi:hypothetical protein